MSRLVSDYRGLYGEYWKKDADKKLERFKEDLATGKMVLKGFVVKWAMGNVVPNDIVELLVEAGVLTENSITMTKVARQVEIEKLIKVAKKNDKLPEDIGAAFPKGTKVVNVLTGRVQTVKWK